MLKGLLISGAVIAGAAVVACAAYLGKKVVNTLEEIADTVEEEELEVAEVTKPTSEAEDNELMGMLHPSK